MTLKIAFKRIVVVSALVSGLSLVWGGAVMAQTVTTGSGGNGYGGIDCTDVTIDYQNDPNLTEAEKLALMDQAFQQSLSKFDLCQTNSQIDPQDTAAPTDASASADSQSAGQSHSQSASESSSESTSESASDGASSSDAAAEAAAQAEANANAANAANASAANADTTDQEQSPSAASTGQSSTSGASSSSVPVQSVATSDITGPEAPPPGASQSDRASGNSRSDGISQGSVATSDMQGTEPVPEAPILGSSSGARSTASVEGDTQDQANRAGQRVLNNGKLPEDIPPADNDSVLEGQIRQAAINEKDPAVQKKLWNEYRKYKGLPSVD